MRRERHATSREKREGGDEERIKGARDRREGNSEGRELERGEKGWR